VETEQTGFRSRNRILESGDSKPAISESIGKALAEFNRGAALLEQYRYIEAAKAFESVLETAPDWTAARFNLGLAYFNMQEKPEAEDYLEMAKEALETILESNPGHLHARFCLGLYHQHLGENEAVNDLVDKQKGAAETYLLAGQMFQSSSNFQKAEELYKNAVTIDPNNILCIERMASMYLTSYFPLDSP
jgi:tetratricopeptide (TPR) repeat protein